MATAVFEKNAGVLLCGRRGSGDFPRREETVDMYSAGRESFPSEAESAWRRRESEKAFPCISTHKTGTTRGG